MSRRRRPRGLRPDEAELWRSYASRTRPLHPEPLRPSAAPPSPDFQPKPKPERPPADLSRLVLGGGAEARGHGPVAGPAPRPTTQPLRMDARAFARMKRGKLGIEARLDLHGMTLDEAQPRLAAFILGAQAAGRRLVLVITGKGRDRDEGGPIPQRPGALRQQVPRWLTSGALRGAVLQIAEAHRSHGGSGAYYVYLRRAR